MPMLRRPADHHVLALTKLSHRSEAKCTRAAKRSWRLRTSVAGEEAEYSYVCRRAATAELGGAPAAVAKADNERRGRLAEKVRASGHATSVAEGEAAAEEADVAIAQRERISLASRSFHGVDTRRVLPHGLKHRGWLQLSGGYAQSSPASGGFR